MLSSWMLEYHSINNQHYNKENTFKSTMDSDRKSPVFFAPSDAENKGLSTNKKMRQDNTNYFNKTFFETFFFI